jgi:hypothetical protein
VLQSLYPVMNAQEASTNQEQLALEEVRPYLPQGLQMVVSQDQ